MRRRFLPFFPLAKPLPLLDIPDPRCLGTAATRKYALVWEKFPRLACLDDGGGHWSGRCDTRPWGLTGFVGQPMISRAGPTLGESIMPIAGIRSTPGVFIVSFALGIALFVFHSTGRASAPEAPKFKVDPTWPKELPNNWIMGQVGGMA